MSGQVHKNSLNNNNKRCSRVSAISPTEETKVIYKNIIIFIVDGK